MLKHPLYIYAFPIPADDGGMTIRDVIATSALPALIRAHSHDGFIIPAAEAADEAYRYAEAMLERRQLGEGEGEWA